MKAKTIEKIFVIAILLAMAFLIFSCEVWHLGYALKHPDKFQFICKPDSNKTDHKSDTSKKIVETTIANPDSLLLQLYQHCSEDNKVITDSAKLNNKLISMFKDSVVNAINNINYRYSMSLKNGALQLSLKQDSIRQLKEIITIKDSTITVLNRTKPLIVIDETGRDNYRRACFWLIGFCILLLTALAFIIYKLIKK